MILRGAEFAAMARIGRTLAIGPALFLLVVAGYILAVTGPVAGVKYRLPIEPTLTVFLAPALLWAVDAGRLSSPADKGIPAPGGLASGYRKTLGHHRSRGSV